ncbi:MAG TPA: hypothetical protein VHW23_06285, partial [Kofleriaceae bacterium]|nr:hypothetical protein [Kofleriaceae bacterium]
VPPFGADTFSSTVLRVVNDPLPRLTVPVPRGLDAAIYRCLEKHPARRFQNTAELAQAIARYAGSETQAALSVQRTRAIAGMEPPRPEFRPEPARRAPPSTLSDAAAVTTPPVSGRIRRPVLAAIGGLSVIGVIALVAVRGGRIADPVPATRPDRPAMALPPTAPSPPVTPPPASPPAPRPAPTTAPVGADSTHAAPVAEELPVEPATTVHAAIPAAVAPPKPLPARPPRAAIRTPKKATKVSTPPVEPPAPVAGSPARDDDILEQRK